jgi:hypothetical protein
MMSCTAHPYFDALAFAISFHSTAPLPVATSAVSAFDTRSVCSSSGAVTTNETSSSDWPRYS